MALGTRCRGQAGGMAIPAGSAFVVDTTAVAARGMRATITGIPITCIVALGAIRAEQTRMIGRIRMAGRASRGETRVLPGSMAAITR